MHIKHNYRINHHCVPKRQVYRSKQKRFGCMYVFSFTVFSSFILTTHDLRVYHDKQENKSNSLSWESQHEAFYRRSFSGSCHKSHIPCPQDLEVCSLGCNSIHLGMFYCEKSRNWLQEPFLYLHLIGPRLYFIY